MIEDDNQIASPTAQVKSLPSSDAASAFLEGAEGGTFALITSTGLRSILIAPGLLIAGVPWKKALLASVISSISITTFILIYMSAKKSDARQALSQRGSRRSRADQAVALLGRKEGRERDNKHDRQVYGGLNGGQHREWRREYRAGRRVAVVKGL